MRTRSIFQAFAAVMLAISCKEVKPEDVTGLTVNVTVPQGSYALTPLLRWNATVSDVKVYMNDYYGKWQDEGLDALLFQDNGLWVKRFSTGRLESNYSFLDSSGKDLVLISFDYFGSSDLRPLHEELERLGFEYKGEIAFQDYNADICHLYLSPDKALEIQLASWEKDGGSWCISFQPTDPADLKRVK